MLVTSKNTVSGFYSVLGICCFVLLKKCFETLFNNILLLCLAFYRESVRFPGMRIKLIMILDLPAVAIATTTTISTTSTTTPAPTATSKTTPASTTRPAMTVAPTATPTPKCLSKLVPIKDAYGFGMEDESYIEFSVMKGKLDSK